MTTATVRMKGNERIFCKDCGTPTYLQQLISAELNGRCSFCRTEMCLRCGCTAKHRCQEIVEDGWVEMLPPMRMGVKGKPFAALQQLSGMCLRCAHLVAEGLYMMAAHPELFEEGGGE